MEVRKGSSDVEDIPNDFFDDFNREEFMEGLSVIDSWDPSDNKPGTSRSRINAEALDSVQDLRELIGDGQDDKKYYEKYKDEADYYRSKNRSCSANRLDEYIKPGSRRDPSKTNEAIKKDKEVKVKEYLAKHLESSDVIRPPGTELDEFYGDQSMDEDVLRGSGYRKRSTAIRGGAMESPPREHTSHNRERRMSLSYKFRWESPTRRRTPPQRYRRPHWSPRRQHYHEVRHSPHRSQHRSPHRSQHRSPHRSPHRPYHHQRGNFKRYNKYSPHEYSPKHKHDLSRSPYQHFQHRSRSPRPIREYHPRSRSRSYSRPESKEYYTRSGPEYSGNVQNYIYSEAPAYSGYSVPYEYGAAPVMLPQPVPAPNVSILQLDQSLPAPAMVPAPTQIISPGSSIPTQQLLDVGNKAPKDALAQLVADGKLSHEDYLKLAPNKGGIQVVDNNLKVEVLHRCYSAISKLDSMVLPNRLIINNELFGQEIKQIAPKFCSPLKRQAPPEFQFSKFSPSVILQQNKKIVDSIISTLSLEKIVGITKKKMKKDSKDVAVQTSKSFCDLCVIRESTEFCSVGTCIDSEQFTATVHTQVVDQDLVSSKSIFNPSGSVTDGAPISIAHMTPAQLVSQLAARAKTLKQAEPQSSNQYLRSNYDQDRSEYQNNYNYRY